MVTKIAKFAVHVGLVFCAFLVAYQLRRGLPFIWWFENLGAPLILAWGVIYAGIAAVVEFVSHTERTSWRFSSARDAGNILRSTAITALIFLSLIFITERGISLPRSTLLLSWLLSFVFLTGARLLWRLSHDRPLSAMRSRWSSAATPLLIVGELKHAEAYLRQLELDPASRYYPAAIVTTAPAEVGLWVRGVKALTDVGKLEQLALSWDAKPAILFLIDLRADQGLSTETIGHLKAAGCRLLRQPSLAELGSRAVPASALHDIPLEEFLSRPPVSLDSEPIRKLVEGRRVAVTGAGGSIGSELARQLVSFGCSHVSLIDHSEFLLFEIDRELDRVNACTTRSARLCNVRDFERIQNVFEAERPDIVFHAAALKHVTLVELNPCEGVLTNVVGTQNVRKAAAASGAQQMVLISTDKAVAPTSVMGATKRLAEEALTLMSDGMKVCAVRFGNVLGSAGSVVPVFKTQIALGGPVTITHPDVERYFMTIPEAVQLVLQAAAAHAGQTDTSFAKYILEMGAPVKIIDLARQMIEMSGRVPDVDIPFVFTGLKAGEKLTETLIDDDEIGSTLLTGITQVSQRPNARNFQLSCVKALSDAARQDDIEHVHELLHAMLPSFRRGWSRAIESSPAGDKTVNSRH